jgi:hypothetical protein
MNGILQHAEPVTVVNPSPMAETIVELVRIRDHVSFAEIVKELGWRGFHVRGETYLEMGKESNVILWANMSPELTETLRRLLADGRIHAHAATPLIYLIDGEIPTLPIARQIRKRGYTKPRWLPVVFRTIPARPNNGRTKA